MPRVPLLSGSRLAVANAAEDAVLLRPPPPPDESIDDVGAAVRDALRYPLAGEPLHELVPRGGRVTLVVQPFELPVPGARRDARQDALVATVDELVRLGVPHERQTILLAGGLGRRPDPHELVEIVSPEFARRFRGRVEIHDVEDPRLAPLGAAAGIELRVHPALVEADAVVVVTAAESVLHGGPAALLGAAGREALRAASADSLLEPAGSRGWQLATALERALAERVALVGTSLTLDHPRLTGALQGYPYDPAALERIASHPLRRLYGALPGGVRGLVVRSLPRELTASAAFAGPPSVAHAEALLRAIEARAARLEGRLDALVVGIPPTTPHIPRERPNPLLAAYLALGLALRLWRDAFPLVEGGSLILAHRFDRHFAHPTQQPYRAFFQATRLGREPEELARAERETVRDERALELYRTGRTCHPSLPFADWDGCQPALGRLGTVIVAGCRDAGAARQLGFVPSHGLGPALAMARGLAGGEPRVGFLLSPPYFPLVVAA